MARTPQRHANRTLLIVGEGDTEVAFLTHVKALFVPRYCGLSVTVRNARGKGPENVVKEVIRHTRDRRFDALAALLDTDLAWSDRVCALARSKRIALLGSTPCLEGMLLQVLENPVPPRSADCKRAFAALFNGDPLKAESYARQFSAEVLQAAAERVPSLHQLLELLT